MPADTKQRVLDATIELLHDRISTEVRTRDVAARAGVNIATIHYYFGSKEALVAAAVEAITTRGMDAWIDANLDLDDVEEAHLEAYLRFLLASTLEYEQLAKTRVLAMLAADDANAMQLRVYDTLRRLVRALRPGLPDEQRQLKVHLLYAAAMTLSCSAREATTFLEADLHDADILAAHVRALIAEILGPAPPG